MTYAAYETGHGSPVELYQFQRGTTVFLVTSHDEEHTVNGQVYTPAGVSAGKLSWQQDVTKNKLTIELPRDYQMVQDMVVLPPTDILLVTVYRYHLDDPDQEVAVIWQGRLVDIDWTSQQVKLTCESVFTSLQRAGLRRAYQTMCPHLLFGLECQLNNQAYRVDGVVSGIVGNTLTAPEWAAHPDGYFTGGYVEYNTQRRAIKGHVTGTLTLVAPLVGVVGNAAVVAYPGCAHNLDDCRTKYNNVVNYGGFPYVPFFNPFTKSQLF